MATTTPNFGWSVPTSTDLVKDGATAIETLGDSIDASLVDLKGGTSGQVLAKNSGTDMDFIWVAQDDSNAIQNAIVDAKGDIIAATASDTPARLAVGTDGQVLQADSTTATGLKWATAGGGGKVLQVVQVNPSTGFQTTSASFVDATNYTASITPTLSTSKVLVIFNYQGGVYGSGTTEQSASFQVLRGATVLGEAGYNSYLLLASSGNIHKFERFSFVWLDSPATTSSTTYKLQLKVQDATNSTAAAQKPSSIILMEIGA
jgi:hypothetical protein